MSKTKLYLAGPMRGKPEFNFPTFDNGAKALRSAGYEVFNPAEHDREGGFDPAGMNGLEDTSELGFSLRDALAADLEFITKEADAIALLSGWENSQGVAAEMATAKALGIPIVSLAALLWGGDVFKPYTPEELRAIDDTDHLLLQRDSMEKEEAAVTLERGAEIRTTSSSGGQKGVKLARFDLIPTDPLTQLAEHYGVGAQKYDDNQWRKGYEFSKSYAALQRHAAAWWGGESIDEETGSSHMAAVAWHAFTLLEFEKFHPEHDDRFRQAVAS